MTSRPNPNQRAAILSSRRQAGESPAYHFRIESLQAIDTSLKRAPGRGKRRSRAAILLTT